jgi:hypothetical protein
MYREADSTIPPGLPPNAPPEPQGGKESGNQTVDIQSDPTATITISIPADRSRDYTGMMLESIVDAQPEGKDPSPPGITKDVYERTEEEGLVRFKFSLAPGSAKRVIASYTVHYEPSLDVMTKWQEQVEAARAAYEAARAEEEFERAKRVIVAKSRVRPRPTGDLRTEERYEILNRMISEAFRTPPAAGLPGPLEIELFHRYFEIGAMFYYVHPSWWKPRYARGEGLGRDTYELTDESEPAPLGRSLGWLIQLDGDRRRNEFLNSPWVRVCVPIRPGLEAEACRWLAKHIEGGRGFNTAPGTPIGALIDAIEARRSTEKEASPGPDYVTLEGEPVPSNDAARAAFPVVDEYEVAVPTEGFVFEGIEFAP